MAYPQKAWSSGTLPFQSATKCATHALRSGILLPRRPESQRADSVAGQERSGDSYMLTSGSAEPRRQTVKEIRRKAGQIATAYNKGALQYLPRGKRQLSRLSDEHASSNHSCRDLQGR